MKISTDAARGSTTVVGDGGAPVIHPQGSVPVVNHQAAAAHLQGVVRTALQGVGLPQGIREIRRARPEDAEAIAAIQSQYQFRKLDIADHPSNGWLFQMSTPDQIRVSMDQYKHFWVALGLDGKVAAYQTICPPRHISRPADKHVFLGPHAERAREILVSAEFQYMCQVAKDRRCNVPGVVASMQAHVLERYRDLPLVAHVAVFNQDDFDAWDKKSPFEPRSNNVASHRYHQKHGYWPVAWTSDLGHTDRYNSGLSTPANDGDGPGPVLGVLYLKFNDGTPGPEGYLDPVREVLAAPCRPGDVAEGPWANTLDLKRPLDDKSAFPHAWPDREHDMNFDEGGFMPNIVGLTRYFEDKHRAELDNLLRR
ncbi:MAG: hypothetical protein IPG45_01440 [Deltaproteobacteria bacterium]|nr:hypothetical protein [Deltaproteobacteria bacterium]